MALLNQNSLLFYDSKGNIHHFLQSGEQVQYIYWDRKNKRGSHEIFCEHVREMKGCMREDDTMYLVCDLYDRPLSLYVIHKNIAITKTVHIGEEKGIRDLTLYLYQEELYLMYSVEESMGKRALISRKIDEEMLQLPECTPERKLLLEFDCMNFTSEILVREENETLFFSVIEKNPEGSSIILLKQNDSEIVEGIAKITLKTEIYWYDIKLEENRVCFVYSGMENGNFSVRYLYYEMQKGSVSEEILIKEKSNCSHPIFVSYMGKLWICWYENACVYSCVIEGKEIKEGPMKWKESVGKELLQHEFFLNDLDIKKNGDLMCQKVFCVFPENNMVGFS